MGRTDQNKNFKITNQDFVSNALIKIKNKNNDCLKCLNQNKNFKIMILSQTPDQNKNFRVKSSYKNQPAIFYPNYPEFECFSLTSSPLWKKHILRMQVPFQKGGGGEVDLDYYYYYY